MDGDPLLLTLWTEVGRHQDLAESVPVFVQALGDFLSLRDLRIDELSADGSDFMSLLQWSAASGLRMSAQPRGYAAPVVRALQDWAARREVVSCDPGRGWALPFSLVNDFATDCPALAGPLWLEGQLIGLAVLGGSDGHAFTASERERFGDLLDPLAAAVANDRRLREIRRLSAAAEADRQTLLSRLGRSSLAESVVGADRGLRRVMERVDQVAATDATVLILGETGAGKEVIARAIHERSARHAGPFVRVNCGAVPPELIDSELFGHEKGSFTGALGARRGWFERADGGTLFLDEIGELTPAVQVRLLRVLQDGIVQRVGSERELAVNVRVIAATHRDLPSMVQEGRFREDLWYRLAIFPVILPPLRERPEDIPLLAGHFIQRAASRLGVPVPPLTRSDLDRLLAYRWPGNVRELSAVIERAVILGRGVALDLETALGTGVPGAPRVEDEAARMGTRSASEEENRGMTLDAIIAAHLQRTLRATGGRIDGPHGAARLLAVNASTLRAKLRKLGINAKAFRRRGA